MLGYVLAKDLDSMEEHGRVERDSPPVQDRLSGILTVILNA
jgi:hypothetical protein